jgi:hypothetical protein
MPSTQRPFIVPGSHAETSGLPYSLAALVLVRRFLLVDG